MIITWLTVIACGGQPPPAEAPAQAPTQASTSAEQAMAEAGALAQAHEAASLLSSSFKARLTQATAEGDLTAAATAYADEAQGLTAQVRGQTGARVGRASLRLRAPVNAGPDWVRAWLEEQGDRPAASAAAASSIAQTDAGPVARVIRPIAADAACLSCHGDPAAIPEGVKAVLAQRYPDDKATGYKMGDLLGALWAEVPVKDSPAAPPTP